MTWQAAIRFPHLLPATPEEYAHLGNLAEEFYPGGRALLAQFASVEREVLIGVRDLIDARIAELDRHRAVVDDSDRQRSGSATTSTVTGPQRPDQPHKITIT